MYSIYFCKPHYTNNQGEEAIPQITFYSNKRNIFWFNVKETNMSSLCCFLLNFKQILNLILKFVFPVFKTNGKRSAVKTTTLLVFFLWLVKSLNYLKIISLLITLRNIAFFLISSIVFGLIDQLQTFSHFAFLHWSRARHAAFFSHTKV